VAVGTGLSRLTGLVRVGVFAWALGQTQLADTFNIANLVPNLVYELVLGGVLSATLVPLFVEHDDDPEARSVLLSVGLSAAVALTLVGFAGLGAVAWLGGGTDAGPRWEATLVLVALVLPQILFYGVTTLATAALNARRIFTPPAFTPVLTNVVSTAALVAVGLRLDGDDARLDLRTIDHATLAWLGLGFTVGVAAMALPLVRTMRRELPAATWAPRLRHPVIARVGRLSGWTVGYVVANQLALIAVTALLATRAEGSVTAYQQAFIFFQLPHGLFAVSLMTTVLPLLSSAHVEADLDAFRARFLEGLRLVLVVVLPAAAGYVALATPLVTLLLDRGAFDAGDAAVTGRTLAAFALGLPGFSVYLYALRAFYARTDTRRPFVLNAVENAINVAAAVVVAAVTDWGAGGFALAFSFAYTVSAFQALRRLDRELGGFGAAGRTAAGAVGRMVAAAVAMGVLVAGVSRWTGADLGWGVVPRVVVGVALGVATYLGLSAALGVDELTTVAHRVRARARRA